MPTNIKCPACSRALEIPDELMGKKVKCPACKMIFTATAGRSSPPSASGVASAPRASRPPPPSKSEEEVRVRSKPPSPPPEEEEEEEEIPRVRKKGARRRDEDYEDEEEEEEEEKPRVRRKAVRRDDEDENEQEDEEDEEEELPRRRSKGPSSYRKRARSIVLAPAISLMVVGGLSVLLSIFGLIIHFMDTGQPGANQQGGGFREPEFMNSMAIVSAITITQVCLGVATIAGSFHLKNLTSYGYALTASIVAMLPCNLCCVAGLPIGVWSLIAIHRSDVKSAWQ